jgi:hypothetical protein
VNAAPRSSGLPEASLEVLASLALHRVLSTEQVRRIHLPGRGERRAQQVLVSLERAGLVAHVQVRSAPRRIWHLTEDGARAAQESGFLSDPPRLLNGAQAGGQLRAHTLAVNDAAICFLETARERGDECGPLAWRQEVAHPLSAGRGRRRGVLIADAVLSYLRAAPGKVFLEQRFLELDRATLPVDRLAAELGRYGRLHRARDSEGQPLWRASYPAFPAVLCVLEGAAPHLLERRRDTAAALLRADPEFSRARGLAIRFCLAAELAQHGPFAPIFADAHDPRRPVDWLGESPPEKGS